MIADSASRSQSRSTRAPASAAGAGGGPVGPVVGGGLGMGGGGGAITGRAAATALGKLTWILAAGFILTSITLTIIAAQNASGVSVLDRLGDTEVPEPAAPVAPGLPDVDTLLPPPSGEGAPLAPRAD